MDESGKSSRVVRFGVFEADFGSGELRRSGAKVRIQDLPLRALRVLLERPNEVVTREQLRQALWPADIFVDFDRAISSAIKRLRDALGDSAENPIFIETLERKGYRWIAPLEQKAVGLASTSAPEQNEELAPASVSATPDTHSGVRSSSYSPWKLVYLIPVVTLLLAVYTFRSDFRSARASSGTHQEAFKAGSHPANAEARDLYLQGRYYWNKRTPDDLNRAVDRFMQAIVHDPGYADPYVGLADCYNLMREYTDMPGREAYPRALAAAKRAVELDDSSSQAHATFAFSSFWGGWDAATADREFRRALELDPNNARAHHWYGTFLQEMRLFPAALVEIERARALDPTSRSIVADKATILTNLHRSDEAIQILKQMEAAEPEFVSPHRYLKLIYLDIADYPNYLAEGHKEAVLMHDSATLRVIEAAEKGYAAGGAHAMFESILREQQRFLAQNGKISSYTLAQTCARAGDRVQAAKYLKDAYDTRDEFIPEVRVDHAFDHMRDDPVVEQIMMQLGLPASETASAQR